MAIPADLMRMMRKRAFLPATDYEAGGIGVSRDEGFAPDLDEGGSLVEEVARKPLVAQSSAATVSGDDNDERGGILEELSQGIDVEERAALNDPRAKADNTERMLRSDRQSNLFLQSAGLAPLTPRKSNSYADERDGMRDWLMRRAGVAQNTERNALNAERTKAYLDSIQAARERDLAAQKFRAEQEGRKADAEKFDQEMKRLTEERKADHEKWERDFKERGLKAKGAKGAGGSPKAPKGFPAGWELEGNTQPTSKQGEDFEKLVFSDKKMRGLVGEMRKLLEKAGGGRVLPGPEQSRLKQLATQIQIEGKNVAELGALSGPDFALMNAIAADPTTVTSFMRDLPGLMDGLEAWGANSVAAKAESLGARRKDGAAPTTKTLSPDDAKALKWAQAHPEDPRSAEIVKRLGGGK